MRDAAARLGFAYAEEARLPQHLIDTGASLFQYHSAYHDIHNVMSGRLNDVAVTLFDYTYQVKGVGSRRYVTEKPTQSVVALQQQGRHQSIFHRRGFVVEPENVRAFIDTAFNAYGEELMIQGARDSARNHAQVELLSVQDVGPKPARAPFPVSLRARVSRLFRGDGSLRPGDLVSFVVTCENESESKLDPYPLHTVYAKLFEMERMEVFLDGQPPDCRLPQVGPLSVLTGPAERFFYEPLYVETDESLLKFYNHAALEKLIAGAAKIDLRNLFGGRKQKRLPTHP